MQLFDMLAQASQLFTGHKWGLLAVLIATWVTQALSQDSKFPISIPAEWGWSTNRWKPLAVLLSNLALSEVTVVFVQHGDAWTALVIGLRTSLLTFGAYAVVVKLLWNDAPPAWAKKLALIFPAPPATLTSVTTGERVRLPPPPPKGPTF